MRRALIVIVGGAVFGLLFALGWRFVNHLSDRLGAAVASIEELADNWEPPR